MNKKSKDKEFEEKFEESSKYTIDDCDIDSAIIVKPTARLKKTYPLSLRISKASIVEAKKISSIRGIPYQTLLKSYIKKGLDDDRQQLAS